jgi:5S rRNA maturation endonuclease (ribonuclease M5)
MSGDHSRECIKERKAKELRRVLTELRESNVLVEGKKDRAALEEIGCPSVFTLCRSVEDVCRSLSSEGIKEVVILTDMDRTGDRLCSEAEGMLIAYRIRPNTFLRKRLSGLLNVRKFEDVKKKLDKFWSG